MNEADKIAKKLLEASDAYYNTGKPIMSDPEYDALRDKLEQLDPNHPFLKVVGAPLPQSGPWPKRKHTQFIGSQAKVTEKASLLQWASKMKSKRVSVSHKLDGSTIVLTYRKGILKHAVTRGDGTEGEDILKNALKMQNVMEKLPLPFTGELRGETMLFTDNFLKHFKPRGYKNERNSANGKARDVEDSEKLVRLLKVVYFDVLSGQNFKTEELKQKFVRGMGLEYVDSAYMDIDAVWGFFKAFDRDSLPYGIDGLIVKINDLSEQEALGMTSGRPNGQIAIKFPPPTAITKIHGVTWQVGLTGRITPVAELVPVELDGVTISRSTLNNPDEIKSLGIAIGDEVVISRRNDVIPKIERLHKVAKNRVTIDSPTKCPLCGNRLEKEQTLDGTGANLICPFIDCAGAIFGNIMTWIKVNKMLGFGRSVVGELVDRGMKTPDKLYALTEAELAVACGSTKTAAKLKKTIDSKREIPLAKFLTALNIPSLGNTNGERLARKFKTLKGVLQAKATDFANIDGIKTNAVKIHVGINDKRNLVFDLLEHVKVKSLDSGKLKGASFAMTGIRVHNGQDVRELITENGGIAKSGVSKGLDYLIIADPNSTSNKAVKAREYGTKLISPSEFMKMVEA